MRGGGCPRGVFSVRRVKSFFYRSFSALLICGLIWGLAQGKGSPARLVRQGVEYLLTEDFTKNHDFSSLAARARAVWLRRGLEVQVSEPRPVGGGPAQLPDLPVTGRLVREFGWQEDRNGWPRFHEGVELAVPKGALVRAVLPGRVIRAAEVEGLGKVVIIEHEGGVSGLYGRLGRIGVRSGQEVAQGQVIGTAAGTFFRFELRQGNRLVDPILRLQHRP